jgi:transposase
MDWHQSDRSKRGKHFSCQNCHVRGETTRLTQGLFQCSDSGLDTNADYNGSMNIIQRASRILSKAGGILAIPNGSRDCRKEQIDQRGITHHLRVGVVKI